MATPTPCRVLVVDDDLDTAQSLAYLLVGMGCEATFLTDPRQVMESVSRARPHIIFLDLGMPTMDGWQVARLLRERFPNGDGLRLVAISGRGDEDARIRSRKAGFDAHVTKPVAINLIEAIIKQMLDR